jgi:ATP-dependent DNA helicase RecQ
VPHAEGIAVAARRVLPAEPPLPPIATRVERLSFEQLCEAHPGALGEPRQQARFLCGLTSPALTAARLSRHALFGALEDRSFADVVAWCGGSLSPTAA